jgi:cold shock CspA family protein
MTGIVRRFNGRYGFVQPLIGDPNATPVYFHRSAIVREKDTPDPAIPKGVEVSFDLCRGDKGPQAANIKLRKLNGRELRRKES